jgi:hypothetical protein
LASLGITVLNILDFRTFVPIIVRMFYFVNGPRFSKWDFFKVFKVDSKTLAEVSPQQWGVNPPLRPRKPPEGGYMQIVAGEDARAGSTACWERISTVWVPIKTLTYNRLPIHLLREFLFIVDTASNTVARNPSVFIHETSRWPTGSGAGCGWLAPATPIFQFNTQAREKTDKRQDPDPSRGLT